jgi:hypothetical protein
VTYSEDFSNAAWTQTNITVNADMAVSPDGELNADSVTEDTSAGFHFIKPSTTRTFTSGQSYVVSVFAKPNGRNVFSIQFGITAFPGATAEDRSAFFDITSGAVGTVGTAIDFASIEKTSNGFFRCSAVITSDLTALDEYYIVLSEDDETISYTGDGTSGIYIYGAQLETGVQTSYIPTAGSQVTRAADALSIDSTLLPYDSTAMTIAMEGEMTYADTNQSIEAKPLAWTTDANNRIEHRLDTNSTNTGLVTFLQTEGGTSDLVNSAGTAYSPGINVPFNIASRHTSSDINGAVDGTALTADTTPTALPDLSATDFEIAPTGVVNIKSLRILGGYGATDAELEAATT